MAGGVGVGSAEAQRTLLGCAKAVAMPGLAAAPATVCWSSATPSPVSLAASRAAKRASAAAAARASLRGLHARRRPRRRPPRSRRAPQARRDTPSVATGQPSVGCSAVSTALRPTTGNVRARTDLGSAGVQNVHAMRAEVRADYEAALAAGRGRRRVRGALRALLHGAAGPAGGAVRRRCRGSRRRSRGCWRRSRRPRPGARASCGCSTTSARSRPTGFSASRPSAT